MNEIGYNVKARRTELGMYQSELAQKINSSQAYIARIESGKIKPSYDKLIALAKALRCSVNELTGTEDKTA